MLITSFKLRKSACKPFKYRWNVSGYKRHGLVHKASLIHAIVIGRALRLANHRYAIYTESLTTVPNFLAIHVNVTPAL